MANLFNQDFRDFFNALNKAEVDYILVGGYAVILHGYNRTTGDLDIWVNPTVENYYKLQKALDEFGIPSALIAKEAFLNTGELDVFTFGRPPVSIDIMTKVKGLRFDDCYQKAGPIETEGLRIRLISYESLIKAKKKAGRLKDINDIHHLKKK